MVVVTGRGGERGQGGQVRGGVGWWCVWGGSGGGVGGEERWWGGGGEWVWVSGGGEWVWVTNGWSLGLVRGGDGGVGDRSFLLFATKASCHLSDVRRSTYLTITISTLPTNKMLVMIIRTYPTSTPRGFLATHFTRDFLTLATRGGLAIDLADPLRSPVMLMQMGAAEVEGGRGDRMR